MPIETHGCPGLEASDMSDSPEPDPRLPSSPGGQAQMVLEGKDDYLFLTNDTSRVMEQVEGSLVLKPAELWAIAMTHAARHLFCKNVLGASYHHWLVPDRETVLKSMLPDSVVPGRHGPRSIEIYKALGCTALHQPKHDVALLAAAEKDAYFKTDTHWTWSGCKLYLEDFARKAVPQWATKLSETAFVESPYSLTGDLGGKVGRSDETSLMGFPDTGAIKAAFDNQAPNIGHVRVFVNGAIDRSERVLVFHDSFGEWLTTLLPHLAHTSVFIHSSDFDAEFVRRFGPSLVLMCQIERFFLRPPLNDLSLLDLISTAEKDKSAPRRFADWSELNEHVLQAT
jgi:alginate O-acetyltransferase complex protein AlgJ